MKLFVCGMKTEYEILRQYKVPIIVSGGNPQHLSNQLESIKPNVDCVVSFGIAGGLNPALKPGALITDPTKEFGLDSLAIVTAQDKAKAWANTKCDAVDMETLVAYIWAEKHGLKFEVARAVADPAQFTLPPAALLPLNLDGSPDYWAVIKNIFCHPGQVPDLIRLNSYTNIALSELAEWCSNSADL